MKFLTLAMILVVIQLSIMMFDNTISVDGPDAIPDMYNSTSLPQNQTSNKVFNFIVNPVNWSGEALIVLFTGSILATLILGAGIVASFFTRIPPDSVLFAAGFFAFLGAGSVPIIGLYNVINREVGAFACASIGHCFLSILLAALTAGLLAFAWFTACLKWWRTGATE